MTGRFVPIANGPAVSPHIAEIAAECDRLLRAELARHGTEYPDTAADGETPSAAPVVAVSRFRASTGHRRARVPPELLAALADGIAELEAFLETPPRPRVLAGGPLGSSRTTSRPDAR